jgi:putative ABC transport system permease protein
VGRDVDAELRFHIDGRIAELMALGMSQKDAEAEAYRRFGDTGAVRAELHAIDNAIVRQLSVAESIHSLSRELRYAIRGLLRRPAFTCVIILTLALGIGANSAIFSFVNAILLRPVPVPWLDRLVAVRRSVPGVAGLDNTEMSPAEAMDIAHRTDLFDASAAFIASALNLEGTSEPQRITAARTLGDFFTLFGARPLIGSVYRAEDSENGLFQRALLSQALWQQAFGGDSSVVGRMIQLSGRSYEVVGVMPPTFRYPRSAQLWTPFAYDSIWKTPERRGTWNMTTLARVRAGVSNAQLKTGLSAEAQRWGGGAASSHRLFTVPFVDFVAGQLRRVLLVLMGAVLLVLLIAVANVASLLLVRAAERSKENAVRAALGAGRWSIARQLLIESLVLAFGGGVLGVAVGSAAVRVLSRWGAGPYEILEGVSLDTRVLAFTSVVTILSALLFGALPALRAARVELHDALKEATRGASAGVARGRFLEGSVVVQLALTLVLLLGSGLMIRSLAQLIGTDPGFSTENLTTMRLVLPTSRYGVANTRITFHERLIERVRALPGVDAVGTVYGLPFGGESNSSPFRIVGVPPRAGELERHSRMWFVGGDYFATMGIRVIRGRAFGELDRPYGSGEIAAVIDETLARQFFPNEDPIGKVINQGPDATIVGVVADVKQADLTEAAKASVYYYFPQTPWGLGTLTLIVRSVLTEDAVATIVRAALKEIDPQLPIYDVTPLAARVERSLGSRRLVMTVLSGFAALSLALAILGIYGVVSYTTAQRTHEIGIRMALGAQPGDVTRMVVHNALIVAAIGLAAGTLVFLGVGRVLSTLVYGVGTHDPLTLTGGVATLAVVALVASYVPARRASRVGPVGALKGN